jgi:alpha-1,2-mannosyltransferase
VAEQARVAGVTIELSDRSRRTMAQVLIVVAVAVVSWLFLAATAARHGYFDLRVYYGAINFWIRDGGQIYDYLMPHTEYGFTYPPFAAVVMSPMAFVGWHTAIGISLVLSIVSLFAVLYWLVGPIITRFGWSRWFAMAISMELAIVFEPTRESLNFGQVNLLLLAVVSADVLFGVRRDHKFAGIGIGLATAVKLTPGVFIVYLLVTRRWKAAGVACASAAAATWLAATVAPDASRVFWTDAVWNTDRVGSTAFISNQSLNGIVSRINPVSPSTSLWAALVLVAFVIWMMRVRRAVDCGDEAAALALTGIFSCLISPITWVHHLVWAIPGIILLFDNGLDAAWSRRKRRALLAWAVSGYALLCSRVVWHWEYHYDQWSIIGSNLYVYLLCGVMIGLPLRRAKGAGSSVSGSGHPVVADVPDLVDLDRRVTAAFDAKDAGLPAAAAGDLVGAARPLVGA